MKPEYFETINQDQGFYAVHFEILPTAPLVGRAIWVSDRRYIVRAMIYNPDRPRQVQVVAERVEADLQGEVAVWRYDPETGVYHDGHYQSFDVPATMEETRPFRNRALRICLDEAAGRVGLRL